VTLTNSMIKAVIFDVDGTLVDSVDLRARAWQEIFREFGKDIPFQEIRMQIGKGGDQLMPVFVSKAELDQENRSPGVVGRYLKKSTCAK
jgi:beta-phosphoglucomutase-like phosphatase (HAD superfamily)